jgi:hypothetical protein
LATKIRTPLDKHRTSGDVCSNHLTPLPLDSNTINKKAYCDGTNIANYYLIGPITIFH